MDNLQNKHDSSDHYLLGQIHAMLSGLSAEMRDFKEAHRSFDSRLRAVEQDKLDRKEFEGAVNRLEDGIDANRKMLQKYHEEFTAKAWKLTLAVVILALSVEHGGDLVKAMFLP